MADRSVKVVLRAEVNQFKADLASAAKSAQTAAKQTETAWDKSSSKLGNLAKLSQQYSAEMTNVGSALAGFGTVVVAGLGLATKAAISWESAWAGVLKTVDGSPKQLAAVEKGLRGLAKTLPATHEEIAAVAEAAGQLGIKTDNVVAFTKTMIDMGESTNLSAEEAATSLSRFMNIMGTSQNEVGRLGAAVVGLGNNFATTEREIVEMSMRIAGAGRQAGLTEGEVMGLATALSSVGIEAEAGGTAISMVMKKMGNSVADGGAELELFARVAGMSSEEFQVAWGENAAGAMTSFITGLGTAQEQGQNTNAILSDLGITGIRESDALLRLSSASGVLTDALKMGNEEYAKGTALAEEAAKRYETAESKIRIAGNSLKDTAITIGGTFLPMIAGAAEAVAKFGDGVGKLPEPVIKAGAALTGIVGTAALMGGGLLILVPRVAETVKAFHTLRTVSSTVNGVLDKTSGSMGKLKGAALGASLAVGALAIAGGPLSEWGNKAVRATGDNADALQRFSGEAATAAISVDTLNGSFSDLVSKQGELGEFGNAVNQVFDPNFWGVVDDVLTDTTRVVTLGMVDMTSSTEEARARFEQLGTQLATLDPSTASQGFQQMAAATDGSQESMERLIELMPAYKDQLIQQAQALGMNTDNATLVSIAMGEVPAAAGAAVDGLSGVGEAADSTAGSLADVLDGLFALGLATLDQREALRGYEEALMAMDESLATNGASLDITTEKGLANQEAFDAIAQAGLRAASSMAENGASQEEVQKHLQRTFDDLVATAGKFGLNADEANAMAREVMGIPDEANVESWMNNAARKEADKTKKAVKDIPKKVTIEVDMVTDGNIRNMPESLLNPHRNRSTSKGPFRPGPWKDGMGMRPNYHGGIDVKGMAAGGVMSVAQMVKPGEIRFAGDRSDVDEAWIPLDGSKRSIDILMEAIRRMPGFGEGMAAGGVDGSAVGGIPVPDTTPITSVWQQMFDQMLATTTQGWAAQTGLWQSSTQAIQATTLASQAAILAATQAHMGQMTGTYQTALTGMSTLVGAQYALMQSTVNASLAAQRGDTQTAYQAMTGILATSLSLMAQTNAAQWSGMRSTQHGHLSEMQANSNQGFTTIRVHGIDQMAALAAGIGAEFGRAPGYVRGGLNEVRGVLNDFADAVNKSFGEIGVELPKIPGFRDGGPISGPGTGTSDSILARVSNGEYIMPERRTREYLPVLESMRAGSFPAYAGGGLIDAANWWVAKGARGSRHPAFGGAVRSGHSRNSLHYQDQAVDLNYGPGGQNATEMAFFDKWINMFQGLFPGIRTIWRAPGHYNHLHIDTANGANMGGGGAISGLLSVLGGNMPADMSKAYSMAAEKKGKELRDKFTEKLPDGLPGQMGSAVMDLTVKSLVKKAGEFGKMMVEPDGDVPGGDKVMRWRPTVIQALQRAGLPTTEDYIAAWLRQIKSESGGNPSIRQQIRDVNSGGNEAQGLVQVIPGTFAAFRDKSLPNDRNHPLANLVAGMNWAKFKARRQGRDMLSFIGRGHGYETGTHSAAPGWALVGENGPEYVRFNGGEQVANAQQSRAMSLAAISQPARMGGMSVGDLKAAFSEALRRNPGPDLASALNGVPVTLVVDGRQMAAHISMSISSAAVAAGRAH